MPFEKFERPPTPPEEEKEIEELSPEEAKDALVSGFKKEDLEKITLDNIRETIEKGVEKLREERKEINEYFKDKSPSEILEDLGDRSSMSHTILCSVNGAEDFKAFKERFDLFSVEHKIDKENKDFKYVDSFLERHIRMKELLTELYKINIIKEIGLAKNEEAFFEKEIPNYKNLIAPVENTIAEFESANSEKIEKLPDLQKEIEELKENLHEEDTKILKNIFYEKICQKYSKLIFLDFEEFNEKDLGKAIENLEK
jgi:hypothetical protein